MNEKPFKSINATARYTGLSASYLRRLLKEGNLPGVFCGAKFMVNVPALLDSLSSQGVKG